MAFRFGRYIIGRPKIGLALSSGSAKGWAHIGVIKALEEEGIKIHAVSGTSFGAIVAAFYAAGALDSLTDFSKDISFREALNLMDLRFLQGGIMQGKSVVEALASRLPVKEFSATRIPLGIAATDLVGMNEVNFFSGKIMPAVRASISIPGFFSFVETEDMQLVDGALTNPVPVSLAYRLGADAVIAADLRSNLENHWTEGVSNVLVRSIDTMLNRIRQMNAAFYPPLITIHPVIRDYGVLDYHRTKEAIDIGYEAAKASLPALRKILGSIVHKAAANCPDTGLQAPVRICEIKEDISG